MAKRLRLLFSAVSLLLLVGALGAGWFYFRLRQSLPTLEGSLPLSGLQHEAVVERDAQGVPTVRAQSRADVARALGFLHAQDRFFQMDLARRRAAGELSALIGEAALNADKGARVHGFRRLAQAVVSRLPASQRELLEAYAAGVNAGLAQLASPSFEYLLLRSDPHPWKPEDSVLLIYAMTLDLQDETGGYEQSLGAVRDILGTSSLAFFAPLVGPEDAALDRSTAPLAPMPTEKQLDVRRHDAPASAFLGEDDTSVMLGSNGFALAGDRTASGAGLLANDMHLTLRVPNIWYRAVFQFPDPSDPRLTRRIAGVTLPGTPFMVAGSNGDVAWGFTDANADVSDLVALDQSTLDPDVYMLGKDLHTVEKRAESIEVRGGDTVILDVPWTVFGPIVGKNAKSRPLALKWTMHDPAAANFDLLDLESARSVPEALAVAQRSGIPVQNIIVVDRAGSIGWTIAGKLPKRVGFDGRLPVSWTFGDRRWEGYLTAEEAPRLVRPAGGQLWTANQRLLGGEALERLGDGGFERAPRGARIRDLMTPLTQAAPADLLGIQLDTRAPHLDRWHALLKNLLSSEAGRSNKRRAQIAAALEPWDGRAEVDSVSYRLVRRFRTHVVQRVLPPLFQSCADIVPEFSYRRFHYEPALWLLLEQRPAHLLNPDFEQWDDLLYAAIDGLGEEIERANLTPAQATWGQANKARIQHPFAGLIPPVAPWLRMPQTPLPGDYDTPRVQAPDDGASERFVVSPGHEEEGIFHMPAGQCGHPLSPFFDAGHDAWVKGEPTPFLPGPAQHTLTFTPAR